MSARPAGSLRRGVAADGERWSAGRSDGLARGRSGFCAARLTLGPIPERIKTKRSLVKLN